MLFQPTFVLDRLGLEPWTIHESDISFGRTCDYFARCSHISLLQAIPESLGDR